DDVATSGLTTPPDNRIVTIFAGAQIIHGTYAEDYGINHVNILRTIEDLYGLSHAGGQTAPATGAGLSNLAITDVFDAAPTPLPPVYVGDFDHDIDVDQSDFAHFQICLTGVAGAIRSGCSDADLNTDQQVNNSDLSLFLACVSGADILPDAGCRH